MFFARETELKQLEKLYARSGFQFVVVYGRRRIGKTTLLKEFCKNKPAAFFVAQDHSDAINRRDFTQIVINEFGSADMAIANDWGAIFRHIAQIATTQRIVVVLDEFPYICNSNQNILLIMQKAVDEYLCNTNLFLVISGSSVSFMENEVLAHKSPLFGRRTAAFQIKGFDYKQSSLFYPRFSNEDKVRAYAVVGGVPQYLQFFDDQLSFADNVKENVINKASYLLDEPKFLLRQELREPMMFNTVIEAIAGGATRLNEIATKSGLANDACSTYLRSLIEMHIVLKEIPFAESANSKRTRYKICDNIFRFWHRFVAKSYSLIEREAYDLVYDEYIEPHLNEFCGAVFEEVAIDYLHGLNIKKELPFIFTSIGRWWGANVVDRRQEEIDIVASNANKEYLFCECKWRNEKIGSRTLAVLEQRASNFNATKSNFVLFAKTGFTEELIASAQSRADVLLVELADMF